jgi:hypothetical protein
VQELQRDRGSGQHHEVGDSVESGAGLTLRARAPGEPAVEDVGGTREQQAEERHPTLAERGGARDGGRQRDA